MKPILPRFLLATIFLFNSSLTTQPNIQAAPSISVAEPQPVMGGFAPDRLIVKLHPALSTQLGAGTGQAPSLQAFDNLGSGLQIRTARALVPYHASIDQNGDDPLGSIFLLELAPGSDVLHAAQSFSNNAAVEWAEPDYLAYPTSTTPNDPLFSQQWGLSQIQAPAAWDLSTGSSAVSIALLDSGLQFNHPDLSGKLWINPGEVPGNGQDDDNNGYIDDVNGWDFVNSDNLPADDNGHGTQTAGVAGAATNNSTGIAGMCWGCTLMPVKVMSAGGVANYSDIAAGVIYSARKGAKVINISLGAYSESSALQAAIQTAVETYGSVVVAGAGNDHVSTPFYPAAYPQVLAVAASGPGDILWGESNYGPWVDLVAPGVNIQTAFLGGDYGAVNGTSLSTAFVSGVAGLLRSRNPGWSSSMIHTQIRHTAQNIDSLNPGFAGLLGSGRVNAYQALSVVPQPLLQFHSQTINGSATARPEPGSSVDLVVSISNDWANADSVQGTLSSSSPYITITTASTGYGDIPTYATAANSTPFRFTISTSAPFGTSLSLNLRLSASGGYVADIPITVQTASVDYYPDATITTQTWTNDRVYVINKNIDILEGNILTIEPGTEVRFEGNYTLTVLGGLIADGTTEQPIEFYSEEMGTGNLFFGSSSELAITDPEGNYVSGSIVRHCRIINLMGIGFNNAAPYIASNDFINASEGITVDMDYGRDVPELWIVGNIFTSGGIYTNVLPTTLNHIVGNNLVFGNNINGAGISAYQGSVNIISNRVINGGITIVPTSSAFVTGNLSVNDNSYGISISGGNSLITHNTGGLFISRGPLTTLIQNNNLLPNASGLALYNNSLSNVDAPQNWWGTNNEIAISAAIHDGIDDSLLGIVNYSDFLTSPEPEAPAYVTDVTISPDTTLGIQTATFDIKFNRDMIQELEPNVSFQSQKHNTWETFTTSNSNIPYSELMSVAIAPDGSKWFSMWTYGAVHFDGKNWIFYNSDNSGLLDNYINTIEISSDGTVWFGHLGGVTSFDGSNWNQFYEATTSFPLYNVLAIHNAPDGSMWFGTETFGAMKFLGGKWTQFDTDDSGIGSNYVTSIATSMDGSIWFGTDSGVTHLVGSTWTTYDLAYSVITTTPDGYVWAGGKNLLVFNGYEWITIAENNFVLTIHSTAEGVVWVGGTYGDITRYSGSKIETIFQPIPDAWMRDITTDITGSLWVGTDKGASVYYQLPLYPIDAGSNYWLNLNTYRATFDITSLIPRGDYLVHISGALGTDGIEIVPTVGFPFTVDYAGGISDTTPPSPPIVEFCAGTNIGSLSATWTASDPQSSITLYSYAVGTTPGGGEVIDWTNTTATSFSRSNLNLSAGQTYYVAVKARNDGGLWSEAGIPPGLVAGSGECTTNLITRYLYLPMVKSTP